MGIAQSYATEYDELRHKYGTIKSEHNELTERVSILDEKSEEVDCQFNGKCISLTNKLEELQNALRELKHEYVTTKREIEDNQSSLKDRIYELNNSLNEIKILDLRMKKRKSSSFLHRH